MKLCSSSTIVFLLGALAQAGYHHLPVDNFTLTRCPKGNRGLGCLPDEESQVIWPADRDSSPPGLVPEFGFESVLVQYESEHRLTWEKDGDEPRNLTFKIGEHTLQKVIGSERSLNFTFQEIATQMIPNGNWSSARNEVLVGRAFYPETNAIGYAETIRDTNITKISGIRSIYILPANFYGFVQTSVEKNKENTKNTLNKKWRIGVGVGVGVGVPLLMLLSFFVGKKKAKKQHLAAKAS